MKAIFFLDDPHLLCFSSCADLASIMGDKMRGVGRGYSQYINNMGGIIITRVCSRRKLTAPNDYFPKVAGISS